MRTTQMMIDALVALRRDPRQTTHHHFWQWVERFRADLVNQAFSYLGSSTDAEDVAQESLSIAFKRLDELEDPSKLGNWLRSINRHNCLAARKTKFRTREVRQKTGEIETFASLQTQGQTEATSRLAAVALVIDGLPEHYREVLVLRYWERMSYLEIAECLGRPLGTIKTQLARADSLLMKRLEPLMRREKE